MCTVFLWLRVALKSKGRPENMQVECALLILTSNRLIIQSVREPGFSTALILIYLPGLVAELTDLPYVIQQSGATDAVKALFG
jgi:hypothetical protein